MPVFEVNLGNVKLSEDKTKDIVRRMDKIISEVIGKKDYAMVHVKETIGSYKQSTDPFAFVRITNIGPIKLKGLKLDSLIMSALNSVASIDKNRIFIHAVEANFNNFAYEFNDQ